MNILFLGDINGKIGRQAIAKILPKLKKEKKIDFVIANADNAAHGSGVTEETLQELIDSGIDAFTNGDHAFDKIKAFDVYDNLPIIRPANYPPDVPGEGYKILKLKGKEILLINLLGRVFMRYNYDDPFRKVDEILRMFAKKAFSAIIVDIHAEATSEKLALKYYLDGRVSAIFGTHTHVMTADDEITKKGTAYITDAGMNGAADQCLGVDRENILKTFLTQINYPHVIPEKGPAVFNGILVSVNSEKGKAKSIKKIVKTINIK